MTSAQFQAYYIYFEYISRRLHTNTSISIRLQKKTDERNIFTYIHI